MAALREVFVSVPGGSVRALPGGGVLCIDAARLPDAPAPTLRREAPWRYLHSEGEDA